MSIHHLTRNAPHPNILTNAMKPEPAAPFPGEPLDADPGVQSGDPGAEPPPASMEQVPEPIPSPAAVLADIAVSSTLQTGRHQAAMIEMLCGLCSMVNLTIAAVGVMHQDDLKTMNPVIRRLAASLRELTASLEAKQPTIIIN